MHGVTGSPAVTVDSAGQKGQTAGQWVDDHGPSRGGQEPLLWQGRRRQLWSLQRRSSAARRVVVRPTLFCDVLVGASAERGQMGEWTFFRHAMLIRVTCV